MSICQPTSVFAVHTIPSFAIPHLVETQPQPLTPFPAFCLLISFRSLFTPLPFPLPTAGFFLHVSVLRFAAPNLPLIFIL
jgi:hypothetical protein